MPQPLPLSLLEDHTREGREGRKKDLLSLLQHVLEKDFFRLPGRKNMTSDRDRGMADYSALGDVEAQAPQLVPSPLEKDASKQCCSNCCCACSRLQCVLRTLVVVLVLVSGATAWFYFHGAFSKIIRKVDPAVCPDEALNGSKAEQGYCSEPNTGYKFPIYLEPLPFVKSSSSPTPYPLQPCAKHNADGNCHTLTGLNLVVKEITVMHVQLLVLGLYVDAAKATQKLSEYRHADPRHVYTEALKTALLAGDVPMTMEWEFSLKGLGTDMPNWGLTPAMKKNLQPYVSKFDPSLTQAQVENIMSVYAQTCYPVTEIKPKDKVRFTWHQEEKAVSCSFGGLKYVSIADEVGANALAKAIFAYTLDDNKNAVVSLLPDLWKWQ